MRRARLGNDQAHAGNTAQYPMRIMNGYLIAARSRHAPTTDIDLTPREFRRYVNVAQADVQLDNRLHRRIAQGRRKIFDVIGVDYLYASGAYQPGQMRDDISGKHKKGIDPLSYQTLWQAGPGSQPIHPGGPGKIAAASFYNPGTS